MNLVQKIAIAYILGAVLLAFGFAVGKYKIFPYSYIQQIEEYIAWNPDAKKTTLQEKLQNWGHGFRRCLLGRHLVGS